MSKKKPNKYVFEPNRNFASFLNDAFIENKLPVFKNKIFFIISFYPKIK